MRVASIARHARLDGRQTARAFLVVLAATLAVVYAGSFGVGFYFDDAYGIQENPAIRSLGNIPKFFTDPFTLTALRENADVRPVLVTTFALNYAISGTEPWSYHAFNLIVHFLTSVLVFLLVRDHVWWPASQRGRDGSARWPAAAAALFFALAPINNQALNYMWARSALLCTAFYVAAFYALLNRRMAAALLLQVLALLTKAIALTLPAVFVAYVFLYRDRQRHPDLKSWLRDWKELIPPLAPLVVVNVVYLVHRAMILPDWADDKLHEAWVTPWIWCISQWPALLHYVRIFVWPAGLSVDHDFPYTLSLAEPRALGSLTLLLAWIAAALGYSKRFPHVAFATLWFFITLAPESTFSPLAEVVNDHRPYIASSLGLSVLLAWLVEHGSRLAGRREREVFVVAVGVLCLGAVAVGTHRTSEWADKGRLWESTVQASPSNGRAWMNAGLVHLRKGDLKEARRYFEKSRQLLPVYPYLYMNLSALEIAEGHPKEALTWAQQAVRYGPDIARSHYYLGNAFEKQGRTGEAVVAYRRATELDPNERDSRAALARATAAQTTDDARAEAAMMSEGLRLLDVEHDRERAIAQFRALLARNRRHYGGTWQLARALDAAGHREEARQVWEKMLAMTQEAHNAPDEAKVRERLAR